MAIQFIRVLWGVDWEAGWLVDVTGTEPWTSPEGHTFETPTGTYVGREIRPKRASTRNFAFEAEGRQIIEQKLDRVHTDSFSGGIYDRAHRRSMRVRAWQDGSRAR